ncbi:MAG: hypothetical protein INQ03_17220 [Candidatus Heimdallarchaeota archaeon]|nr:hypothetical protein [Candidatus Heimdallarchaeota archaeon]
MASFMDIEFNPDKFVNRSDANNEFEEFVKFPRKNLFLLLGEAAFGKTWLIAKWANEYLEKEHIVFYVPLREGIEYFFDRTFGRNSESTMIQIQKLATELDKPMIWLFDGYDEASSDIKSSIINKVTTWLDRIPNQRILISSRNYDWSQDDIIMTFEKEILKHLHFHGKNQESYYLNELTEKETISALERYGLPDKENFVYPINTLLKFPLWIRLFSEYHQNTGELVNRLNDVIYGKYFERMQIKEMYILSLSNISFELFKKGDFTSFLRLKSKLFDFATLDRLNSSGILLYYSKLGRAKIKLSTPAFGWYGTALFIESHADDEQYLPSIIKSYERMDQISKDQIALILQDFDLDIETVLSKKIQEEEIKPIISISSEVTEDTLIETIAKIETVSKSNRIPIVRVSARLKSDLNEIYTIVEDLCISGRINASIDAKDTDELDDDVLVLQPSWDVKSFENEQLEVLDKKIQQLKRLNDYEKIILSINEILAMRYLTNEQKVKWIDERQRAEDIIEDLTHDISELEENLEKLLVTNNFADGIQLIREFLGSDLLSQEMRTVWQQEIEYLENKIKEVENLKATLDDKLQSAEERFELQEAIDLIKHFKKSVNIGEDLQKIWDNKLELLQSQQDIQDQQVAMHTQGLSELLQENRYAEMIEKQKQFLLDKKIAESIRERYSNEITHWEDLLQRAENKEKELLEDVENYKKNKRLESILHSIEAFLMDEQLPYKLKHKWQEIQAKEQQILDNLNDSLNSLTSELEIPEENREYQKSIEIIDKIIKLENLSDLKRNSWIERKTKLQTIFEVIQLNEQFLEDEVKGLIQESKYKTATLRIKEFLLIDNLPPSLFTKWSDKLNEYQLQAANIRINEAELEILVNREAEKFNYHLICEIIDDFIESEDLTESMKVKWNLEKDKYHDLMDDIQLKIDSLNQNIDSLLEEKDLTEIVSKIDAFLLNKELAQSIKATWEKRKSSYEEKIKNDLILMDELLIEVAQVKEEKRYQQAINLIKIFIQNTDPCKRVLGPLNEQLIQLNEKRFSLVTNIEELMANVDELMEDNDLEKAIKMIDKFLSSHQLSYEIVYTWETILAGYQHDLSIIKQEEKALIELEENALHDRNISPLLDAIRKFLSNNKLPKLIKEEWQAKLEKYETQINTQQDEISKLQEDIPSMVEDFDYLTLVERIENLLKYPHLPVDVQSYWQNQHKKYGKYASKIRDKEEKQQEAIDKFFARGHYPEVIDLIEEHIHSGLSSKLKEEWTKKLKQYKKDYNRVLELKDKIEAASSASTKIRSIKEISQYHISRRQRLYYERQLQNLKRQVILEIYEETPEITLIYSESIPNSLEAKDFKNIDDLLNYLEQKQPTEELIDEYYGETLMRDQIAVLKEFQLMVGTPIPKLKELEDYDFGYTCRDNKITGISLYKKEIYYLPDNITNLHALEILNLRSNHLSQLHPGIGSLSNLRILLIRGNSIDSLPDLSGLIHLERLSARWNRLKTIHPSVFTLPSLKVLNFATNDLDHFNYDLSQLINLLGLHLEENKITSISPTLNLLANLQVLNLADNQLEKIDLSTSTLKILDLSINFLSSAPFLNNKMKFLEEVYLQSNEIEELPEDITSFRNLLYLDVSDNPIKISKTIRKWLKDISKETKLRT